MFLQLFSVCIYVLIRGMCDRPELLTGGYIERVHDIINYICTVVYQFSYSKYGLISSF